MKNLSKILLLILLSILPGFALAQKTLIRGTVMDGTFNEPMAGASVVWQNKDGRTITGAQTDFNGNFSFSEVIHPGDVLRISFSGYKTQIVGVSAKNPVINVTLQEELVAIKEVEVVTKRKVSNSGMISIDEKNVTTSQKKIDMAELEDLAVADVTDALQGRVAGVDMVATSGAPGAGMSIRIRGTTSINGSSEPLVVVDGFPYETTIDDDFDFATADEDDYATMLNISPDDIKEITVLKDAAATAIYGSKAANGVLLITTKRGAVSKASVSYSFKGSLSQPGEAMPMLSGSEYNTLIMEELFNAGRSFSPWTYPELANDANNPYNYYNYGQNTNWYNELTRNGHTQDHSVSISGGSQKAQYRLSFNYYDAEGNTIGEDYSRLSSRLNMDYEISSKLRFSASMAYTYSTTDRNYVTALNSKTNVLSQAFNRAPNMGVYEFDELGNLTDNYFTPAADLDGKYWKGDAANPYNPVAMANQGSFRKIGNRVIPNLSLSYRPFYWLRYTLEVGLDINNEKQNAFVPQSATGRPWTEQTVNVALDKDNEAFVLTTFNKIFLTPKLPEGQSFQSVIGLRTEDSQTKNFAMGVSNTASSSLVDPSNGGYVANSRNVGSSSSEVRTIGAFAQVNYTALERYSVMFTANYEGSSKFGAGNRWALYPSASLRWRISGEPFLEKFVNKINLSEWSVRASYGESGSSRALSTYASQAVYSPFGNTYLGQTGMAQSGLQLASLKWENTKSLTLGTDLGFLEDRINMHYEWYYKTTDQLIIKNRQIPTSTGYNTASFINQAGMENHGWEFDLDVVPYRSTNWTIKFNMNLARNENKLKDELESEGRWTDNTTSGHYPTLLLKDQPLGSFYGYIYEGVYLNQDQTIARDAKGQKIYTYDEKGKAVPVYMRFNYPNTDYQFVAGDAKYKDVNHDGNINEADVVYLGNGMPLLTGGFGLNVKYKQWSLNTFFNFRYGNDVINMAKANAESMRSISNQSTSVLRRWRHEYSDAQINNGEVPAGILPRAVWGRGYNSLASNRYVEDGSFLRFKTATLSYQFPKQWLQGSFVKDAKIYVQAQNIYCWTHYTGMDPEISISSPTTPGYDNANTPRGKEYTVGVNLKF